MRGRLGEYDAAMLSSIFKYDYFIDIMAEIVLPAVTAMYAAHLSEYEASPGSMKRK